MTNVTLTDPVAGTGIVAGLHVANNSSLRAAINGGIDNNNIAATAKIDGVKLGNDVPRVYARLVAAVDVVSTGAETTLFTQSITAGDLGTNRRLIIHGGGDYLHNNVAGDTITVRFKFGGTTFATLTSSLGGTTGATRRPWGISPHTSYIANQLSASVQNWSAQLVANDTAGGVYTISPVNFDVGVVDTTSIQTFAITAQWSASSANNSWRVRECFLLLV